MKSVLQLMEDRVAEGHIATAKKDILAMAGDTPSRRAELGRCLSKLEEAGYIQRIGHGTFLLRLRLDGAAISYHAITHHPPFDPPFDVSPQ